MLNHSFSSQPKEVVRTFYVVHGEQGESERSKKQVLELTNKLGREQAELIVNLLNPKLTTEQKAGFLKRLGDIGREVGQFCHENPKKVNEALVNILSASLQHTFNREEHLKSLNNLLNLEITNEVRAYLQKIIGNLSNGIKTAKKIPQ